MRGVALVVLLSVGCVAEVNDEQEAEPPPTADAEPAPSPQSPAVTVADAAPAPGPPTPMVIPVSFPRPCPDLYDQSQLPTFEVDLPPETLAKLDDLFINHARRKREGVDLKQYLPANQFRYRDELHPGIEIRLKGNDTFSWAPAQQKMQFVIRFPKERLFHGVRRLSMDGPWYDPSLLRERMATQLARDVGLVASCVNNARLVINGAYYGLYANIEFIDERYLRRNFAEAHGNLWKNGLDLEEGTDDGDQRVLNRTFDIATLRKVADLDQWVREWALEAVMPHGDGYWCAGHNWLTYHDPTRGWQWLLYDTDAAFGWGIKGPEVDPTTCAGFTNVISETRHYKAVLAEPEYARKYRAALESHAQAMETPRMQGRLDAWNAQIAEAAEADPNRTFKAGARATDVMKLRTFLATRREFLRRHLGP